MPARFSKWCIARKSKQQPCPQYSTNLGTVGGGRERPVRFLVARSASISLPPPLAMPAIRTQNDRGEFILKISLSAIWYGALASTLISLLALAGCSAFQPDPRVAADQKESLLSAAGFKMLPADTPDKLAHAQSLPQLKVKYFTAKDGTLRYWMADAQYCQCVYIGDETAFQKFKQEQFQAQLAAQQNQAAEIQAEAAQEEQMEFMDPVFAGPMWVY
jgi:hypothetical protein